MNKKKKEFVLDCCNPINSKLRPYQSRKDIYLAGYFALKEAKVMKSSKLKIGKNLDKKKRLVPKPYIENLKGLKQSRTAKSLPPLDSRRTQIHPVSKEEFKELLSKFRSDKHESDY